MAIQNQNFRQQPYEHQAHPIITIDPNSQQSEDSLINPNIAGNRLYQNDKREIILASKTPGEVIGEQLLLPIIQWTSFFFQSIGNFSTQAYTSIQNAYTMMPSSISFPNLFPVVGAQVVIDSSQGSCITSPQGEKTCISPITQKDVEKALQQVGKQDIIDKYASSESGIMILTTKLFEVILADHHQIEKVDSKILTEIRDSENLSIFQYAAQRNDLEILQALIPIFRGTYALSLTDASGKNALHYAAIKGNYLLIPELTRLISVNLKDINGMTALHWAIHERRVETVKNLIKHGASINDPWVGEDGTRFYPLGMVVAAGDSQILQIFLENDHFKEINFQQAIAGMGTVLHVAILQNQAHMLKYLLESHYQNIKALLEITDSFGRTPLQLAAYLDDRKAIEFLVDHDAEINRGDGQAGGAAIHYAADGEQPDVIELLDYLGANLLALNHEGLTAKALISGRNTPKANECKALLTTLPNRLDKTRPPNFTRRHPFNLVFQGGGPRGVAYVGALRKMEQQKLLSQIKRVSGTSAGAITAALVSVGYSSQEIQEALSTLDFAKLLDGKGELEKLFVNLAQKPSVGETIKILLSEYWGGWTTLLHPQKHAEELLNRLNNITGLCSGEELRTQIDNLIFKKTGINNCTFKELRELIHKDPKKYKELHIFATLIKLNNNPEIVRFSPEDSKWDDLVISDAVRASSSIPGIFTPHILHFKDQTGTRHAIEHHGQFVDGGLLKNYPLEAFDGNKYQEDKYHHGDKTNRRTLGLSLQDVEPPTIEKLQKIASAQELIQAITLTYYHAEEIIRKSKGSDGRTITIPIKNVGLLDFNLKDTQKEEMIASGEEAVDFFLDPISKILEVQKRL